MYPNGPRSLFDSKYSVITVGDYKSYTCDWFKFLKKRPDLKPGTQPSFFMVVVVGWFWFSYLLIFSLNNNIVKKKKIISFERSKEFVGIQWCVFFFVYTWEHS